MCISFEIYLHGELPLKKMEAVLNTSSICWKVWEIQSGQVSKPERSEKDGEPKNSEFESKNALLQSYAVSTFLL